MTAVDEVVDHCQGRSRKDTPSCVLRPRSLTEKLLSSVTVPASNLKLVYHKLRIRNP